MEHLMAPTIQSVKLACGDNAKHLGINETRIGGKS